ncbi:hypothetical protein MRX96_000562 [Rhipicephalus microplus]
MAVSTRTQILEPSTSVPEEIDVSEWKPTWTTGLGCYVSMALLILAAAQADVMISKQYGPRWGSFLFDMSLLLVPSGMLIYLVYGTPRPDVGVKIY